MMKQKTRKKTDVEAPASSSDQVHDANKEAIREGGDQEAGPPTAEPQAPPPVPSGGKNKVASKITPMEETPMGVNAGKAWEKGRGKAPKDEGVPDLRLFMQEKPAGRVRRASPREVGSMFLLSFIDLILTLSFFGQIRGSGDRLYNLYEARLAVYGADGSLASILLVFTLFGAAVLGATFISVECLKQDHFRKLMGARLVVSTLPNIIILSLIVFSSEGGLRVLIGFCGLVSSCVTAGAWAGWTRQKNKHHLGTTVTTLLDILWGLCLLYVIALISLYASNEVFFLRTKDCPRTFNKAMPVYVKSVDTWFCAKWYRKTAINREPDAQQSLMCDTTYMERYGLVYDGVEVTCPPGCLTTNLNIYGCETYGSDSSICVSAIHAGRISDGGGTTRVFGQRASDAFESCLRNSVSSLTRINPGNVGTYGFHFNTPNTQEFIYLQEYDVLSSQDALEADKPWTRIRVRLAAKVAAVNMENHYVFLGERGGDVEVDLCVPHTCE
ncbi:unnamed protein product [Vitrella brassicaformis CCMP3155]|uniref:LCCL domain-containing protein n=2 Tax=Vitrella brassicaformis TaxID=1169539 RepID=A0A0G4GQ22_VITBC|nr:unnamed protein product [Vitrella brassicaformis CCMP3155]|mmetsp:Transcript_16316/g.39085  ORF Transcript_16316/g.39085 Transcript_16316/m.39085 type:complete len:498 (+) Transcript_16316:101-1594(+)|eukprot:CEM32486.1 unnamed protein product [Vitrella brassicaformis CCMP3155]